MTVRPNIQHLIDSLRGVNITPSEREAFDQQLAYCTRLSEPEPDGDALSKAQDPDARKWARAFIRTAIEVSDREGYTPLLPDIDEGWLIGWFANAIETGRSVGAKNARTGSRKYRVCTTDGTEVVVNADEAYATTELVQFYDGLAINRRLVASLHYVWFVEVVE